MLFDMCPLRQVSPDVEGCRCCAFRPVVPPSACSRALVGTRQSARVIHAAPCLRGAVVRLSAAFCDALGV
jgi:hypothetical protein